MNVSDANDYISGHLLFVKIRCQNFSDLLESFLVLMIRLREIIKFEKIKKFIGTHPLKDAAVKRLEVFDKR